MFGSGKLDVSRYGRLLKSRQLVGLRAPGCRSTACTTSSGEPDIKRGEYKQSFTLARNALVSTVPTVPV